MEFNFNFSLRIYSHMECTHVQLCAVCLNQNQISVLAAQFAQCSASSVLPIHIIMYFSLPAALKKKNPSNWMACSGSHIELFIVYFNLCFAATFCQIHRCFLTQLFPSNFIVPQQYNDNKDYSILSFIMKPELYADPSHCESCHIALWLSFPEPGTQEAAAPTSQLYRSFAIVRFRISFGNV